MNQVCSWVVVEFVLVEEVVMDLEYDNAVLANTLADNYVGEDSFI
jgi:hypothetical protein